MDTSSVDEKNVLITCASVLILVGWTVFHGCSDRAVFSVFGVVTLLFGWAVFTFAISEKFEDMDLVYVGIGCAVTSVAIAIPYFNGRRNASIAGFLWGAYILAHGLLGHHATKTMGRQESIATFLAIGAITIGAAFQFGQRRLNFEWVQTGRFNPYNTVFSLGTVLNAFGWGAVPFVFGRHGL